jgi:uncharacterized protein involved in exopolysaccharide biosynthesis
MPDLFSLIQKWWKQCLLTVFLSFAIVAAILFLQPNQYLSVTTALPANPSAADKASVFNTSVQELYTALGTPDDLDKIIGTSKLDTIYLAVTDQFNLQDHYPLKEKGEAARTKAASLLKKQTKVMKTEYGELQINVWDTDKNLAPQLANALLEKLSAIHQDVQNKNNQLLVSSLQKGQQKIYIGIDSINSLLQRAGSTTTTQAFIIRKNSLLEQAQQYEKLIGEYQLMADNKPAVLAIVEKARVSAWPDKPRRALILTATTFLSFLFAIGLALVFEKRKTA